MTVITSVTQKGQITLPKSFRDKLGIRYFDKVAITISDEYLKVEPTKDILDLAGSFKPKQRKSVMGARKAMAEQYKRG